MERNRPKIKDGKEYNRFLQKEKMLKKVEAFIQEEINKRSKEQQKEQNKNNNRNNNRERNQETEQPTEDFSSELKDKMANAGVDPNSAYWRQVLSSYDFSSSKQDFVKNWSVSASYKKTGQEKTTDKIIELRGEGSWEKSSNDSKSGSANSNSQGNSSVGSRQMSSRGNSGR